jgi:hypothetical protein
VKNNLRIQFAKKVWFKHLTYVQELIPFITRNIIKLGGKNNQLYVLFLGVGGKK